MGIDPDAGLVALVELDAGADTAASQERVERVAKRIFLDPAVGLVSTYYSTGDEAMVSRDGDETFIVANFQTLSDRRQQLAAERLRERFADDPGIRFGGEAAGSVDVKDIVRADIARAQLVALPLMFALSFWLFRGLAAALLPLIVGGLAGVGALAALRLANELVPVSIFALNLVLGLALALALDYGLLIVSRYREEIARDGPGEAALRRTMQTAGRTVLYSSLAIACAMAALLLFPQRFIYSMGIGGILVALVAGTAALIVLPAVLTLLGERVNSLAPRRLQRAAAAEARPEREGAWYRLSRLVMRRPLPIAAASALVLIALGIPFLRSSYAPPDVTVLPDGTESREVREALDRHFDANLTLPLFAVLDGASRREAREVAARIEELPGASRVETPRKVLGLDVIAISPRAGPLTDGAEALVSDIRGLEVPGDLLLGGRAADHVDQKASIAAHLPAALALLCGTTLLVLFWMTGSVVLPIKAVVMSLLALSAALGILVLVFQDGRLEGLLGYESPGTLDLAQPLVLLAIGFGISTDYGIFLLNRIKEARDAGLEDREAVALGLERSGRVITAAALLVCVALGALSTSEIVLVKELGLGIAAAVVIEATVVRALLVPSLMTLLGRWNWWSPAPLRRLHRRLVRAPA